MGVQEGGMGCRAALGEGCRCVTGLQEAGRAHSGWWGSVWGRGREMGQEEGKGSPERSGAAENGDRGGEGARGEEKGRGQEGEQQQREEEEEEEEVGAEPLPVGRGMSADKAGWGLAAPGCC